MSGQDITRRKLVKAGSAAVAAMALPTISTRHAYAADTFTEGLQIGAMGALRTALPVADGKYDLVLDPKDFRDSTAVLLAIEQGQLDIGNTTTQHLIRAISENIPIKWVCGWGGGYNVLVSRKGLDLKQNDSAALKSLVTSGKQSGKQISIGVPTGSLQHAKLMSYLKSIDVDPDNDIQTVNIPFPNHPRALQASEIDLAMTLSVFGAIAIDKNDAVLFLHLFGEQFGKQEVGFIVAQKLIEEKPALVQRIVNAHVEAIKTFMGQPDRQIEYEKKYSQLPDAVIAMQERDFLRYNFRTNVADIKTMARELHQLNWVKEDYGPKAENFIDLSFVAKASGLSQAELSTW